MAKPSALTAAAPVSADSAHWCAHPGCGRWGSIRAAPGQPWLCGPHDRAAMLAGDAAAKAAAPAAGINAGGGAGQRFAGKQGMLL